ncbi:MAG TPA: CaiB/BaiF CoA-transferase family protein [Hyphomicrobiaceae bacterium]|nr:CaiB/BaiF CoA-transferase family protein [Hyphomicrobiaceae bacterium]
MGPLKGVRIIEMAGIGPAPFCGMMLSDMGAEVIRVDRSDGADLGLPGREPRFEVLHRGRQSVAVDVKSEAGRDIVRRLVKDADALIEGFRPGVMERLGLGPQALWEVNPRLVFGRMTGFGQDGPMAPRAGHDINYIALSGALHAIGHKDGPPIPPLNLVGDFGGGGMLLAFGVLCGILEARTSGKGQVVDAAMVDGASLLMAGIYGFLAGGMWKDERGENILDTGAPWYGVYETKDGKWVSIGSIEKRFYADLLERLGIAGEDLPKQYDRARWPALAKRFAEVFKTRTRDEWCAVFADSDACFAPVLAMKEVAAHPHNAARATFVERDGVVQPAPGPRFSRTPPEIAGPAKAAGADSEAVLKAAGYTPSEIAAFIEAGVVSTRR